jgi:hypothetical protein
MIIKLTIDRIEGNSAVLISKDSQSINWPVNFLPIDCHEGQVLEFFISKDIKTEAKNSQLAKNILNEILNADNEKNPN